MDLHRGDVLQRGESNPVEFRHGRKPRVDMLKDVDLDSTGKRQNAALKDACDFAVGEVLRIT